MHNVMATVWHHPFAKFTLDPSIFKLPQWIPSIHDENRVPSDQAMSGETRTLLLGHLKTEIKDAPAITYRLQEGMHPSVLRKLDEIRMPQ
jgi:hypothetical protein